MYDKNIKINKNFKSSVNLLYDLDNDEKILEYIPTTDLCDVIKKYVYDVIDGNGIKSTFLAGPYGKGKSYLMLIISYIFSNKKNNEVIELLINKIRPIDQELADLIYEINSKKINLLPVIINNNDSDDIYQNFMIALRNALFSNHLESLIPDSTFDECISIIDSWERNKELDLLKTCQEKLKLDLNNLKQGLRVYSKNSYDDFLKLFECINHGYKFNSLTGNDISNIYISVTKKLKKYGYSGMLVVFDEFGVFLENKTNDFSLKLNKIQAFAERCNSSVKGEQIHFCCVTHKDISLYQGDKLYSDDFEKISGRFKQLRFDRSLDENYQIICNAIVKLDDYDIIKNNAYLKHHVFIEELEKSRLFEEKQLLYIKSFGFPFNPISLYALIQVSEKIAQNERTLFTFLSDNDLYSFNYFITNNNENLLNIDYIFNYFQNIIKNNSLYKSLYIKVDSLSKVDPKKEHHNIFKCLAIMKIINDELKFNTSIDNISLALGKPIDEIKPIINELIELKYLKKNINDDSIDFDLMADNELNELIEKIVITKTSLYDVDKLFSEFNNCDYVVSHQYNFEFSMIRYFYNIYLDSSKFRKLNDLSSLYNDVFADGYIINIINNDEITVGEIERLLKRQRVNISSKTIIRYSNEKISSDVVYKLKRYLASVELLSNSNQLSSSSLECLKLSIEDIKNEISLYIKEYFNNAKCINILNCEEDKLKATTYNALVNTYCNTVIFNNDQVNKNVLTSATTKARNNVVDYLLGNSNFEFGNTSQEGTILESFNDSLNSNKNIIEIIQNYIMSNSKVSCADIIYNLTSAPYGMRFGIIPLFIAKAVSMLKVLSKSKVDTVLFYNGNVQISLDALNINKMMENPKKYFFNYRRVNRKKIKFVNDLAHIFKVKILNDFNIDIENVVKGMKMSISNLDSIIIKSSKNDNVLELSDNELRFKDLLLKYDLNTYEFVFENLSFLGNDYDEIVIQVNEILNSYEIKILNLYDDTINYVKRCFLNSAESIKTGFQCWKLNYSLINYIIFENNFKKLYNVLNSIPNNDVEAIDNMSLALLNCRVSDWNLKKKDKFMIDFNEFIKIVSEFTLDNTDKKDYAFDEKTQDLSNLGKTLYNNLNELIEEYGESLTNSEKANVLKKLLKDIMN